MVDFCIIGTAQRCAALRIEWAVGERVPEVATRCRYTLNMLVDIDHNTTAAIGNEHPLHTFNTFHLMQMVGEDLVMIAELFLGDRAAAQVDTRFGRYQFSKLDPFTGKLGNLATDIS